jgi:toxin YoeB
MSYYLEFSKQAQKDIEFHKKSGNQVLLRKIFSLLNELTQTPCEGLGKPEQLKHELSGLWSRRINQKHRLIYEVLDTCVLIHSLKRHYS